MTTQNAPLEKLLASLRVRKITKYIQRKTILDFGCGKNAWASRYLYLQGKYLKVIGYEPSLEAVTRIDNLIIHNQLETLIESRWKFDAIISLAVFEHIKPMDLRSNLKKLLELTHDKSIIVGTIPRPESRAILEFLSLRLGLIDKSQILDHKVYYDDLWLQEITEGTGWQMSFYKKFQLGMNGLFILRRSCEERDNID